MAAHIPGPLFFHQQGPTGIPMIFLHSTPDDHRLWMYQQAHFSSWYRTIAVDLAGYGRSPTPQKGITIPMKNTWDKSNREELITIGGMSQVPCLVIDGKAMYESDDIIAWLGKNYKEDGK